MGKLKTKKSNKKMGIGLSIPFIASVITAPIVVGCSTKTPKEEKVDEITDLQYGGEDIKPQMSCPYGTEDITYYASDFSGTVNGVKVPAVNISATSSRDDIVKVTPVNGTPAIKLSFLTRGTSKITIEVEDANNHKGTVETEITVSEQSELFNIKYKGEQLSPTMDYPYGTSNVEFKASDFIGVFNDKLVICSTITATSSNEDVIVVVPNKDNSSFGLKFLTRGKSTISIEVKDAKGHPGHVETEITVSNQLVLLDVKYKGEQLEPELTYHYGTPSVEFKASDFTGVYHDDTISCSTISAVSSNEDVVVIPPHNNDESIIMQFLTRGSSTITIEVKDANGHPGYIETEVTVAEQLEMFDVKYLGEEIEPELYSLNGFADLEVAAADFTGVFNDIEVTGKTITAETDNENVVKIDNDTDGSITKLDFISEGEATVTFHIKDENNHPGTATTKFTVFGVFSTEVNWVTGVTKDKNLQATQEANGLLTLDIGEVLPLEVHKWSLDPDKEGQQGIANLRVKNDTLTVVPTGEEVGTTRTIYLEAVLNTFEIKVKTSIDVNVVDFYEIAPVFPGKVNSVQSKKTSQISLIVKKNGNELYHPDIAIKSSDITEAFIESWKLNLTPTNEDIGTNKKVVITYTPSTGGDPIDLEFTFNVVEGALVKADWQSGATLDDGLVFNQLATGNLTLLDDSGGAVEGATFKLSANKTQEYKSLSVTDGNVLKITPTTEESNGRPKIVYLTATIPGTNEEVECQVATTSYTYYAQVAFNTFTFTPGEPYTTITNGRIQLIRSGNVVAFTNSDLKALGINRVFADNATNPGSIQITDWGAANGGMQWVDYIYFRIVKTWTSDATSTSGTLKLNFKLCSDSKENVKVLIEDVTVYSEE